MDLLITLFFPLVLSTDNALTTINTLKQGGHYEKKGEDIYEKN
jgi:hypothetical protein